MTASPTDAELLERFYACDATALDLLADRYDAKVAGFLIYLVKNREDAETLVDNLWTHIFLSKGSYHAETRDFRKKDSKRGSVEGYLIALAGHLAWEWMSEKQVA